MPDIDVRVGRLSARLTPWLRSWRAGLLGLDQVVDAMTAGALRHVDQVVCDMPGSAAPQDWSSALPQLSTVHPDEIRLVLPVPGDVRGLPTSGSLAGAAVAAGEAVTAGSVGIVPERSTRRSGSGDTWEHVAWHVHSCDGAGAGEALSPGEAELMLTEAIHEATAAMVRLDVARWRPELGQALTRVRGDDGQDLPVGYDSRTRRLYARAVMLDRTLVVAEADAPGASVTAHEARARAQALRPLATACRQALVAACNAPLSG